LTFIRSGIGRSAHAAGTELLHCRRLQRKTENRPCIRFSARFCIFSSRGSQRIFRFVELIWTWSVDQVAKLAAVPWHDWPILKVILLAIVVVAVIWALYRVVWELWLGAERILSVFATLLVVFAHTLPRVLLAGAIALAGLWLMNHLDNSMMSVPTSLQVWQQHPQQPQPQAQPD
jgi:hypothetical protein